MSLPFAAESDRKKCVTHIGEKMSPTLKIIMIFVLKNGFFEKFEAQYVKIQIYMKMLI